MVVFKIRIYITKSVQTGWEQRKLDLFLKPEPEKCLNFKSEIKSKAKRIKYLNHQTLKTFLAKILSIFLHIFWTFIWLIWSPIIAQRYSKFARRSVEQYASNGENREQFHVQTDLTGPHHFVYSGPGAQSSWAYINVAHIWWFIWGLPWWHTQLTCVI